MRSRRSDFRRCARLQKDHQCWIATKQQNGQKIPQPVNRFRYTLSEFRFFSLSSLFMQFWLFLAQCDHGSYAHAHKHLHFLANRLLVSISLASFAHSEVEHRGKDCTMCLFSFTFVLSTKSDGSHLRSRIHTSDSLRLSLLIIAPQKKYIYLFSSPASFSHFAVFDILPQSIFPMTVSHTYGNGCANFVNYSPSPNECINR